MNPFEKPHPHRAPLDHHPWALCWQKAASGFDDASFSASRRPPWVARWRRSGHIAADRRVVETPSRGGDARQHTNRGHGKHPHRPAIKGRGVSRGPRCVPASPESRRLQRPRHALTTSSFAGNGELCGHLRVKSHTPVGDPATPVIRRSSPRISSPRVATLQCPTRFIRGFYIMTRQVDGAWRVASAAAGHDRPVRKRKTSMRTLRGCGRTPRRSPDCASCRSRNGRIGATPWSHRTTGESKRWAGGTVGACARV